MYTFALNLVIRPPMQAVSPSTIQTPLLDLCSIVPHYVLPNTSICFSHPTRVNRSVQ